MENKKEEDASAPSIEHNNVAYLIVTRIMVIAISQTVTALGETSGLLIGAAMTETVDIILSAIPMVILIALGLLSSYYISLKVFFDSTSENKTNKSSMMLFVQNRIEFVEKEDEKNDDKKGKLYWFIQGAFGRFFVIGNHCWYNPDLHPLWAVVHKFHGPANKLEEEEKKMFPENIKMKNNASTSKKRRSNEDDNNNSESGQKQISFSFKDRLRGNVAPFSLLVYAGATLLASIFTGLAKADAENLCPTMLALIAVINTAVFLFDIVLHPVMNIPIRGWINLAIDGISAIMSIIIATSLTTMEEAEASPELGKFVSVCLVVVVIVGSVFMLLFSASAIIVLKVAKVQVVPEKEHLRRSRKLFDAIKTSNGGSSSLGLGNYRAFNDDENDDDNRGFHHHHHRHERDEEEELEAVLVSPRNNTKSRGESSSSFRFDNRQSSSSSSPSKNNARSSSSRHNKPPPPPPLPKQVPLNAPFTKDCTVNDMIQSMQLSLLKKKQKEKKNKSPHEVDDEYLEDEQHLLQALSPPPQKRRGHHDNNNNNNNNNNNKTKESSPSSSSRNRRDEKTSLSKSPSSSSSPRKDRHRDRTDDDDERHHQDNTKTKRSSTGDDRGDKKKKNGHSYRRDII